MDELALTPEGRAEMVKAAIIEGLPPARREERNVMVQCRSGGLTRVVVMIKIKDDGARGKGPVTGGSG